MKRRLTYLVLEATLWIGISLLVSSGWAETERNVISFVSTTDEDHPIILMNTQGEVLQKLITEPGQLSASTWSLIDVRLSTKRAETGTVRFI